MNKLIVCIFSLVNVVLSIKYRYGVIDDVLMISELIMFAFYFKRIKHYKDHLFVFFMLFYISFSVHVVSLFELTSIGFNKDIITYQEYRQLAIWGNRLFFIILTIVSLYGKKGLIGNNQAPSSRHNPTRHEKIDKLMILYMVFVYFLQFISFTLGITGSLEDASIQLPFHLNGIIDELRTSVCQFAFCIYLFHKFEYNGEVKRNVVLMYIIYAFLEIFVKNSKGAFVFSFLSPIVIMFMMEKIHKKILAKYVLPLVAVFVISYPIIETARQEYGQLSLQSLQKASQEIGKSNEKENSSPYVRAFLTGVYYTKVMYEVNPNQDEFDFTRVPMLVLLGGGASYMTSIIDQYPAGYHHSSGITGLCDALLWGGYPLCYIVVAILTLFALLGDRAELFRKKPLLRLIFFFWFYSRFVANSVSFIIDPLFFSAIGSILIKIILTSLYYKKYGKKSNLVCVLSHD